jgi:hypothetical protein
MRPEPLAQVAEWEARMLSLLLLVQRTKAGAVVVVGLMPAM